MNEWVRSIFDASAVYCTTKIGTPGIKWRGGGFRAVCIGKREKPYQSEEEDAASIREVVRGAVGCGRGGEGLLASTPHSRSTRSHGGPRSAGFLAMAE